MFFSAFIIVTVLCSSRLSMTAAAVPVASDGFIIPVGLQQSSNDTHSSNITEVDGLQSLTAIHIGNSTNATNDFFRYPVPGTKYVLFVTDCSNSLDPTALKATFLKGISYIDTEIYQGRGAVEPEMVSAYIKPILVEWQGSSFGYHCPYYDLLHLWKALRLVLLDKSTRFPSWLYARECTYLVNWHGVPGDPRAAGEFEIKDMEPEGALAGNSLGGTLNASVGTG